MAGVDAPVARLLRRGVASGMFALCSHLALRRPLAEWGNAEAAAHARHGALLVR